MTRHLRILLFLLVLGLPAVAVSACGGVPGNAVATVDGEPIQKSSFDHWMNVLAKSSGQAGAPPSPSHRTTRRASPQLRKTAPKPAKGQPKVTDASLKSQCKQQYNALRDQALAAPDLDAVARGRGRRDEDQGLRRRGQEEVDEFKKSPQFAAKGSFEKFLKQAGATNEDIALQARAELLTQKITDKVTKGKDKVSDAEITDYYNKNKARFAQPERRDLRVVLTKTKAKADAGASSALDGGDSFSTVAKKFSIDQASKAQGGKLPGVAKGQQEKALDDAVFGADKGELTGPVKTQFGFYVFEVSRSRRPRSRPRSRRRRRSSSSSPPRRRRRRSQNFARRSRRSGRRRRSAARASSSRAARAHRRPRRRRPRSSSSQAPRTATP